MARLAAVLACLAGAVFLAIALLTVVSVGGRVLSTMPDLPLVGAARPVPGDFELVEAGLAIGVFACLALAQWRRAHVRVDLLTGRLPFRLRALLDLIANVLMTAIAVLIAWRLLIGLSERLGSGQTTMILAMPVWIGYAGAAIGAVGFVIVSACTIGRSVREFRDGAFEAGESDGLTSPGDLPR